MEHPFLNLFMVITLLGAIVTDLRSYKIPNWLTLTAMVAGLLGHASVDGLSGFLFSLKGLGVGLALFLVFYVTGGMGAGDVKLLAAVGSFIGAEGVFSAGIMAMLLGGLYAIGTMISHWGARASLNHIAMILQTFILTGTSFGTLASPKGQLQLRYGLVIGLGTLMSQWLKGPLFIF